MVFSRSEIDVGMSQYIGCHTGFQGIVKMRYQDFLVNEIDVNGKVVHLTDVTCDNLKKDSQDKPPEDYTNKLSDADKEKLMSVIKSELEEVLLVAGETKQERTEIHKAIRWIYPTLESETIDNKTEGKFIKVTKSFKGRRTQNNRSRMPRKTLCQFVLYKENIGTMEAINTIAARLHLKKSHGFQYGGTKDKRAVTVQVVTAPVAAERLCGLNKSAGNIRVGNFSYCKKPLQLGDLMGNHFSLIIRNVKKSEVHISAAFESFNKCGFINYFGMQRFGTTSVATYKVGIAILQSNWQKVVDLLLSPRESENDSDLNHCLTEYYNSGNIDSALELLKCKNCIEGILLRALGKCGKSQLVQAISAIPRNTRMLYLHSYQSFVWNRIASKRIQKYGLEPIEGDIVLATTYKYRVGERNDLKFPITNSDEPPSKVMRVSASSPGISHGFQDVETLSKEDLMKFTIHDIILPLPGHDISYPKNEVKTWYHDMMKKDGIDMDTHMVHKVKEYSLPGAYRNIVTLPTRVNYDLLYYDDYSSPLLLTDLDRLNNKEIPKGVENGKFTALRVEFSLPSSSYATVALREILKIDISFSGQMELNKQHLKCAND